MTDLIFPCPKCKNNLVIDETGANSVIACPYCKTRAQVPPPSVRVNCPSCRHQVCIPQFMVGATAACPSCNVSVKLQPEYQEIKKPTSKPCVGCGRSLEIGDVICTACGVNQSTGIKVQAKLTVRTPVSAPDEINPILMRYQRPIKSQSTITERIMPIIKVLVIVSLLLLVFVFLYLKRESIKSAIKNTQEANTSTLHTNTPAPSQSKPTSPFNAVIPSPTNAVTAPLAVTNRALDSVSWGMPRAKVKSLIETNQHISAETASAIVCGNVKKCELDCIVAYLFNNDAFIGQDIAFAVPKRRDLMFFTEDNDYLPEYMKIRDLLKVKYGNYVEEHKDIDGGLALPPWQAKVEKQEEAVAFENKKMTDLKIKLHQEFNLELAKRSDRGRGGARDSNVAYTMQWQDFENTQRRRIERQQVYIDDEVEKLKVLQDHPPKSGWRCYVSRYTASDCAIRLICFRNESGVRMVLSYRADASGFKNPMDDL